MQLYEYIVDAKKIVRHRFGGKLSKDEDLVANVASALMKADQEFDGRGTLSGYRYSRAIYAVKNYRKLSRKRAKKVAEHIVDVTNEVRTNSQRDIKNYLAVRDILTDVDVLPERQADALRLYHLEGFTLREISSVLGISHEMVRLDIHAGIKTLREKYGIPNKD